MSEKVLPSRPSLDHLKHQARDLLKAQQEGNPEAATRLARHVSRSAPLLRLRDAQFVVAREYGFDSWSQLRADVETITQYTCSPHQEPSQPDTPADAFLRLACLTYGNDHPGRRTKAEQMLPALHTADGYVATATGDLSALEKILATHPEFARTRGGPNSWEPILYLAYSRVGIPQADWLGTARLLLQHGANPNAAYLWDGTYLFTALTGAFGEGEAGPVNLPEHPQCDALAELLLHHGADPNDSQTLYNRQFEAGTRHLEILLKFGLGQPFSNAWRRRLSARFCQNPSALLTGQLCWAAEHGHLDRIRLLLNHGADPNGTDRRGRSLYEIASLAGHPEIARALLDHGAKKVDLLPLDQLAAACLKADRAEIEGLLENSPALLEELGGRKEDLLNAAAGSNRLAAVRLMVELGFPLNAMHHSTRTPLHEAAWHGHLEMAKLLIELGANPTLRDRSHQATPADYAAYNQKLEVAEYLKRCSTGREAGS